MSDLSEEEIEALRLAGLSNDEIFATAKLSPEEEQALELISHFDPFTNINSKQLIFPCNP